MLEAATQRTHDSLEEIKKWTPQKASGIDAAIEDAMTRSSGRAAWEVAPGTLCLLFAGVITAMTATSEPTFHPPPTTPNHDVPARRVVADAGTPE